MTERGRAVAERIADCYVEVDIEREFDSKAECRRLAESEGFELIASGLSRNVFVPDDRLVDGEAACVVKIPTRLLGAYETRREIRYWNRLPEEATRYLAPVWDHGLEWLLMPRAETDLTSEEITRIWSGLSAAGWYCEDANWAHNLGRVNGRPVVLDYGAGCHPLDELETEGNPSLRAGSNPSRNR